MNRISVGGHYNMHVPAGKYLVHTQLAASRASQEVFGL